MPQTSHPWPDDARFAIYTAPPESSALDRFGRDWLGWHPDGPIDGEQAPIAGLSHERWRTLTQSPRHYGFHGTLKAPFALTSGKSYAELTEALSTFAAKQTTVTAAPLALRQIAGFLALVPSAASPTLHALADDCVTQFDSFRRGETAEQVENRRNGLSARQSALLDRWGYPYVFEEFRFHMTLTERLPVEEANVLIDALTPLAGSILQQPLTVDEVCLFAQRAREEPFRLIERFPFAKA